MIWKKWEKEELDDLNKNLRNRPNVIFETKIPEKDYKFKVTKKNHQKRKSIAISKVFPNVYFHTDPESNVLYQMCVVSDGRVNGKFS
jgi:hypothetical protein